MMTATVVRRSHTRYQANRNSQTRTGKRKAEEHREQMYTVNMINRIIAAVQAGHKVYVLRYHDASDHVRSMIYADYTTEQVYAENYPDGFAVTAFGTKRHISWRDYQLFLIHRCAKEDAPMDEYIRLMDLIDFDPASLIEEPHGAEPDDGCYLTILQF